MFEHLAVRGVPGAFAFHPANGAYRKPVEAARLKALGVRPGVPDVIVIYRGKTYAIELKAESGRATAVQLQAIEDIRAAGGNAQVCCGLDCLIATLEGWGLLRGQMKQRELLPTPIYRRKVPTAIVFLGSAPRRRAQKQPVERKRRRFFRDWHSRILPMPQRRPSTSASVNKSLFGLFLAAK